MEDKNGLPPMGAESREALVMRLPEVTEEMRVAVLLSEQIKSARHYVERAKAILNGEPSDYGMDRYLSELSLCISNLNAFVDGHFGKFADEDVKKIEQTITELDDEYGRLLDDPRNKQPR